MTDEVLHDVQGDFLGSQARAQSSGAIANLEALLDQKPTSSSTAPPASSPSAAAAPAASSSSPSAAAPAGQAPSTEDMTLPLGTRVLNAVKAAPAAAASQFTGDIAASWNQLKSDYLASVPDSAKYAKAGFWDSAKMQFQEQLSAGKTVADAFNLVMSPISSALDVATTGIGEGAHAVVPAIHAQALKDVLDKSMIAIGPEGGLAGVAAKTAEAGEAARVAAAAAKPAAAEGAAAPAAEAAPARDYLFAGTKPDSMGRLRVTDADRAKAADYLNGKIPDNPIQASLDTLSDTRGAQDVIKNVARFIPEGAVKPDDVLAMGAYSQQRTPAEILNGLKSVLPTDEEILSWKMTMEAGGAELKNSAKAYVDDPSPENRDAAVKAFALSLKMVRDWDSVGTEQARAFRARQLGTDSGGYFDQNIRQILTNAGPDNVEEAIRKAASLDDPEKVPPFIALMHRMLSRDSLLYGWYNILLSNPKTIVKKLTSDAFTATWNVATRRVAEGSGGVEQGEAGQLAYGYLASMMDGIRAAGRGLKAGQSEFMSDYQTMDGMNKSRIGELAKGADEKATATPTGAAVAFLRSAMPTSWIGAADDFAKLSNYRAELRALSFREASSTSEDEASLAANMSRLMNDPPEAMHEEAVAAALKNTYQEPLTGIAQRMSGIADTANLRVGTSGFAIPFGRMVLPFLKVPANLLRFAYRNSPLPLVTASDTRMADLAAGGSRRALANAGIALGAGVSALGATLSAAGVLTGHGPSDPQMRRAWMQAGNQPYTLRLGGKAFSYQNLEPLGLMLGPIADTADVIRFAHDNDAEQAAWSLMFGIGNAAMAPTYMMGLAELFDALQQPDEDAKNYGENLVSSIVVPQGVVATRNALDPWRRAHYNLLQAIESRTPGLSQKLPLDRTLWGEPIPLQDGYLPGLTGTGVARALSPVGESSTAPNNPIDKWIYDNRKFFPQGDEGRLGLTRPGQTQSFSAGNVSTQVQLSAQQVDRLRVLAGNGLKDPQTKLGARDSLNALVGGAHPDAHLQQQWNRSSPELRAVMVQRIWGKFRGAAKMQLLSDDKGLQQTVMAGLSARGQALTAGTSSGASPSMPQFGGL